MYKYIHNLNFSKNNCCFSQNEQPSLSTPKPDSQNCQKTIPNKSKNKSDKNKRSDSKRSITKFFKSSTKESNTEQPQPTSSKRVLGIDGNAKSVLPTKVKSGSWKRSDKTNTVLNVLTNKKTKALRKKSPNLLAFTKVPIKLNEKSIVTIPITSESNSACRPGTLYSDVLIGAAPSNLMNVKILTPRRSDAKAAQNKLTNALFKYTGNEKNDPTTDESELEGDHNVFPSLQPLMRSRPGDASSSLTSSSPTPCSGSLKSLTSLDTSSNSDSVLTSVSSPTKIDFFEEPDVVILSEPNEMPQIEANRLTYGNYLEQQFPTLDMNCGPSASKSAQSQGHSQTKSQFHIDIPSWNFTIPDSSPHGFPKFLQQFDDENYLKMEKLALDNGLLQGKFKY